MFFLRRSSVCSSHYAIRRVKETKSTHTNMKNEKFFEEKRIGNQQEAKVTWEKKLERTKKKDEVVYRCLRRCIYRRKWEVKCLITA